MNEKLHITDLKTRLGLDSSVELSIDDQLQWAKQLQNEEPMSPWRLRIYNLLTDHDIQLDWMGMEKGILLGLLEDLDVDRLKEKVGKEQLLEYLVDLGGWHEPGASINYWLNKSAIVERVVGFGSRNPYHQPSMTSAECQSAFDKGRRQAEWESMVGGLWVGLRSLNPTSSIFASMQLFIHAGVPFQKSLGPIVNSDKLESIAYVAEKSVRRHPMSQDPFTSLTFFGGYDLAYTTGFICGMAAEGKFTLLSDLTGYAATFLAEMIQPGSSQYVSFAQSPLQEWVEENRDVFRLPSVFQSQATISKTLNHRLAMFHLHSIIQNT